MKRETKPINDIKDIPPNLSDEDQIAFLETHGVSEEFLERTEEVPENERPHPRTQPINVRFDSFTLGRLKDLANRRNVGYQTLLKEFVVERLYEEEKREGMLTAGHPREARPQPGAAEQPRGINTAAKELADVLIESYQTLASHGDSAYELSDQRAEQFFNSVISNLQTQAEANLQIAPSPGVGAAEGSGGIAAAGDAGVRAGIHKLPELYVLLLPGGPAGSQSAEG